MPPAWAHAALAQRRAQVDAFVAEALADSEPAIVFPIGRDAAGRPISVQAIARPGGEAMLLALARQAGHSRFGGRGFAQQPGLPLARSRERV
ncbi:amidase [Bordetella pertussis]|nr:amidase [Bordetella pertussis]